MLQNHSQLSVVYVYVYVVSMPSRVPFDIWLAEVTTNTNRDIFERDLDNCIKKKAYVPITTCEMTKDVQNKPNKYLRLIEWQKERKSFDDRLQ